MFGLLVHGYPARWCYALGAIAAREFVHDINKRVEASVCVGPRFGELAEAAVGPFAELPQAQVGFPGVVGERHRDVHQLANHARIRLNQPHRVGLAVFEQLDVRGKLRLLLNDEIHPRFEVIGHAAIIA